MARAGSDGLMFVPAARIVRLPHTAIPVPIAMTARPVQRAAAVRIGIGHSHRKRRTTRNATPYRTGGRATTPGLSADGVLVFCIILTRRKNPHRARHALRRLPNPVSAAVVVTLSLIRIPSRILQSLCATKCNCVFCSQARCERSPVAENFERALQNAYGLPERASLY